MSGRQDAAAGELEGFDGVALDAQAAAEIEAALLALAARQREIDAAVEAGDVDAVAMQIDDVAVPLVRLREHDAPYYGPLQLDEEPVDADPVLRIAGEADWVQAGAEIPEGWREWIEAAEARGEVTPAVPLSALVPNAMVPNTTVQNGVAEVKKLPRKRRSAAG